MDKITRNHFTAKIMVAIAMGVAGGSVFAGGLLSVSFGDATFTTPTIIDNEYWPLLPAGVTSRAFTYIGETEDGCVIDVISTMEGDIRAGFEGAYAAMTAQVIRDEEWEVEDCDTTPTDEDLAELTFDWYAQDDYGNIWYLGEASRDFGDGCPSQAQVPLGTEDWGDFGFGDLQDECTEGSWEAGQYGPDGEIIAEAGIVVPSDFPTGEFGDPLSPGTFFMQELAEGAEDMAKILKLNASVSIESGYFAGDWENCRKVKEWTALEPGGSVEHKYYCPGPGLLLINGLTGGPTESEVLMEMNSTP